MPGRTLALPGAPGGQPVLAEQRLSQSANNEINSDKRNLHIRYAFPSSDIPVENNAEAMRPIIEHPKLLQ